MKKTITFTVLFFLAFVMKGYSQVNTYPYVQTGDVPVGWSVVQSIPIWSLEASSVNPAGVTNDAAIVANFFSYAAGPDGLIISPYFDLTGLTKPVLNFYVAYRSYTTENDSLQVLVSTDGGANFVDFPTPYRKSFNSIPSLATGPSQQNSYNPSASSQWRHESIDLTAYAGMSAVFIGFRAVCGYGNNLWIDNFIINDADSYCQYPVTFPGSYSCGDAVVSFNTIGLSPQNGKSVQTDNPTGGVLSMIKYENQSPPSVAPVEIATNVSALNAGGTVTQPNVIYQDSWYTVTYTGNDLNGYANYNFKFDISNYSDFSKLYVLKRADMTAPWECQNTTFAGNYLVVSGLTTFSDFAIAGDSNSVALPVELSSFTSAVNGRNVTLNWSTASELNNSVFEIERSVVNGQNPNVWTNAGRVAGSGNSTVTVNYSFTDRNLASGKYNYRLKQTDFNGNFEYFSLQNEVIIGVPSDFAISQNYPNPFNPSTTINYELPFDSKVTLRVFDMSGKEVASLVNGSQNAGYYTYNFNASGLSSGVYFYNISAEGSGRSFNATKKMMLIK